MTGNRYLRYSRRISGQIALVVISSIVLALGLAVVFVIVTRRSADLDYRSHADVHAFLGVMRLIDVTPDENIRTEILHAAASAFPNLRIERLASGQRREGAASTDRYAAFLSQTLGPGFSVDRIHAPDPGTNNIAIEITSPTGVAVRSVLPLLMPPPRLLTPIMGAGLVFVALSLSHQAAIDREMA